MPEVGIEPTRGHPHASLSRARLPVPPLRLGLTASLPQHRKAVYTRRANLSNPDRRASAPQERRLKSRLWDLGPGAFAHSCIRVPFVDGPTTASSQIRRPAPPGRAHSCIRAFVYSCIRVPFVDGPTTASSQIRRPAPPGRAHSCIRAFVYSCPIRGRPNRGFPCSRNTGDLNHTQVRPARHPPPPPPLPPQRCQRCGEKRREIHRSPTHSFAVQNLVNASAQPAPLTEDGTGLTPEAVWYTMSPPKSEGGEPWDCENN